MATTGNKWLTGCAVGCVVLLVVLGLAASAGFLALRSSVEGFRQAGEIGEELAAVYGPIEAFIPPETSGLPATRLELFVQIRESLEQPARRLEQALHEFPARVERDDDSPLRTIFNVFSGLDDLLGPMGDYVEARNAALLDAGMSSGEYLFYYGLVYYAWLGHDPDEAAASGEDSGGSVQVAGGRDASFGPQQARRRYRAYTQAMLNNMLQRHPGDGSDDELRRFRDHPRRVAWRDSMPPAWEKALTPWRTRLEPTYSAAANGFEWPAREGESGFTLNLGDD